MNPTMINKKVVIVANRFYAQLDSETALLILVRQVHFLEGDSQYKHVHGHKTSFYEATAVNSKVSLLESMFLPIEKEEGFITKKCLSQRKILFTR